MTTGRSKSAQITITYLSDRPMSEDAKLLVINDVQRRMDISNAEVSLEHINQAIAEITFAENALTFPEDFNAQLDQTGGLLQKYPDLNLMLSINLRALENKALRRGRFQAIASYLQSKWQIESSRVTLSPISSSNKIISSAISDNLSDVNNNPVETTLPTLPQDGKVIFQFKM